MQFTAMDPDTRDLIRVPPIYSLQELCIGQVSTKLFGIGPSRCAGRHMDDKGPHAHCAEYEAMWGKRNRG